MINLMLMQFITNKKKIKQLKFKEITTTIYE